MKFLLLVPLIWVSCFSAKIPSFPEDAYVISSEEENEFKVSGGNIPIKTSFNYRNTDGSFESFIELRNGEVNWEKGLLVNLYDTSILIKEGFTIRLVGNYWKTELYMVDHQGLHRMAYSRTSKRPELQRIRLTIEELMKFWPERIFHNERLDIDEEYLS